MTTRTELTSYAVKTPTGYVGADPEPGGARFRVYASVERAEAGARRIPGAVVVPLYQDIWTTDRGEQHGQYLTSEAEAFAPR